MRVKRILSACLAAAFFSLCLFDPSLALENVRIAYPSMSSSVLYFLIANKQGYYKEEGLNVEILSIRGEIAIRTALAGEVDFFTNAGSALAAAVRGVPVKIIAVTQDTPSWDLIATPQIKSIAQLQDRKSTRLNSSHGYISYAVFCLKKKKKKKYKTSLTTKL